MPIAAVVSQANAIGAQGGSVVVLRDEDVIVIGADGCGKVGIKLDLSPTPTSQNRAAKGIDCKARVSRAKEMIKQMEEFVAQMTADHAAAEESDGGGLRRTGVGGLQ